MRTIATDTRERSTPLTAEHRLTVEELRREFPDAALPVLSVGTIFVSEGTVAVSGTVSEDAAEGAELTINGHSVTISELGSFCAVLRLQGRSALKLSLRTPPRTVTLDVPLRAL